jgi:thioredoxin-dependent peroxiredoxin
MELNIGDPAPDFELPDHTGDRVRLRDFRGKSSVVLAFYVYASTPG